MKTILKISNDHLMLPTIAVFERTKDDAEAILYPIIVDGNYYHLRKNEFSWYAIGLSNQLCHLIGDCIEQKLYENSKLN